MGRGTYRERRRGRRTRRTDEVQPADDDRSTISITGPKHDPVLIKVNSFDVDIATDYVDATIFSDHNKTYLAGLRTITIKAH